MKYELQQNGKLIGTYDSIDSVESKIADLVKARGFENATPYALTLPAST
jgi:hypothetical protein